MKCAIIGLGWLGVPLAKYLSEFGHEISGTTRSTEKQLQLQAHGWNVKCWDAVTNEPLDTEFFQGCDVVVVNLPPGKLRENNLYVSVCETLALTIPASAKVIFISTTGIYPDTIITADENKWSRSLNLTDNLFALTEERLHNLLNDRLTIVRFAGLIGPNRNPARFLAGKTDVPNPNAPVNLIHLNDCIQVIYKIIEKQVWGEVFNACSSEHPKRQEYYTTMCQRFGLKPPTFNDVNTVKKLVTNTKSMQQLGIEYSHSIWMEEGKH
jgi:nucleoside-diphosphate-sugar epimerase